MNDTHIDNRELDRLADGELSPAALRDLFARLDQTDDGWRRAALALLEAQALRSACRDAMKPVSPTAVGSPAASAASVSSGRRELLAIAAAIYFSSRGPSPSPAPSPTAGPPTTPPLSPPAASPTPAVRSKINAADGQVYVWIPPGSFAMGCSRGDNDCGPDEQPVHTVRIRRGFWLARTEVTNGQWVKHMKPAPRLDRTSIHTSRQSGHSAR